MLNGKGLDERTSLFKAMREKELELITALGGDPSPQQQAIIADSVKNMLYIASLDNYLMGLKSLVRKGKPHPVLAIRTQLSAHLRENLKTLGLKRVSKALTVTDVLNGQDENQQQRRVEAMTALTTSNGQSEASDKRRAENMRQDCVNAWPKRFWTVCESFLLQAKGNKAAGQAWPLLLAAMPDGRLRTTPHQGAAQQSGHHRVSRFVGSGVSTGEKAHRSLRPSIHLAS